MKRQRLYVFASLVVCLGMTLLVLNVPEIAPLLQRPTTAQLPRWSTPTSTARSGRRPAGHKLSSRFPNIRLLTQDRQPVLFYDDLVKDKIVLVTFMYTTCDGT